MKKTILALFACAFAAVALPSNKASALAWAFETGNDLLQECSSVGERKGLCMGFMEGVIDTVGNYAALQAGLGICLPMGGSQGSNSWISGSGICCFIPKPDTTVPHLR
jgi:hypothetical protein